MLSLHNLKYQSSRTDCMQTNTCNHCTEHTQTSACIIWYFCTIYTSIKCITWHLCLQIWVEIVSSSSYSAKLLVSLEFIKQVSLFEILFRSTLNDRLYLQMFFTLLLLASKIFRFRSYLANENLAKLNILCLKIRFCSVLMSLNKDFKKPEYLLFMQNSCIKFAE